MMKQKSVNKFFKTPYFYIIINLTERLTTKQQSVRIKNYCIFSVLLK